MWNPERCMLWSATNLCQRFVGKKYGIMGDGIFTFNRKKDQNMIIRKTQFTNKTLHQRLSDEEREHNKNLAGMRVEVEHFFDRMKTFAVFDTKYRHFFRYGLHKLGFSNCDSYNSQTCLLENSKISSIPISFLKQFDVKLKQISFFFDPLFHYQNAIWLVFMLITTIYAWLKSQMQKLNCTKISLTSLR